MDLGLTVPGKGVVVTQLTFVLVTFCGPRPGPRSAIDTRPISWPRAGRVWHLCTRAESARMTVPGSYVLVQAIMSAIDDYAERETGNREYFWNRPQGAGG